MNAVAAITHDHDDIRDLIDRIGRDEQDAEFLLSQLRLRLAAHDAATETQIYRELLRESPACSELVGTRTAQHRELEIRLDSVERDLGTEDFSRSLTKFSDKVASEMESEESTVLPVLRQVFTSEWLDEVGRRYELRWLAEMDARIRQRDAAQEPTA